MDKDKLDDTEDNVWNASGVILDIDSGPLIPFWSFCVNLSFLLYKLRFPTLICQTVKKSYQNEIEEIEGKTRFLKE